MQANRPPFLDRLQSINTLSDRFPRRIAIAVGIILLSLAVLIDWRPMGTGIAFPLYYLIPICILAWFAGWIPTLGATIVTAGMSFAGLLSSNQLTSFSVVFVLGRILTFALSLLIGRILATIRLMIDYFVLGDQLRARIVPIRIGPHLVSIPTRDPDIQQYDFELMPDDIPLLIRPGTAFGSGSHATTQMCLMLLEDHLKPGQLVFDFGSGSGILSIAAAKLGARAVYAADIAPRAARVIRENIQLNQLEDVIRFQQGSWPVFLDPLSESGRRGDRVSASGSQSLSGLKADILVANILTYVIVEALKEGLTRCVAPGGKLILSGIRADQWDEIREALDEAGLSILERRQMQEWLAVVASNPVEPAVS